MSQQDRPGSWNIPSQILSFPHNHNKVFSITSASFVLMVSRKIFWWFSCCVGSRALVTSCWNLLLSDELSILVVPEVETLGMSCSETLDVRHAPQLHPHQLVSDPERGRKVNIQLHSLAHTRGNIVLGDAEIHSRLKPETRWWTILTRDVSALPVEIVESETVSDILRHLGARVLVTEVMFTQPDHLPILSPPGDCWSAVNMSSMSSSSSIVSPWCSCCLAVQCHRSPLSGQSVSAARLVNNIWWNWKIFHHHMTDTSYTTSWWQDLFGKFPLQIIRRLIWGWKSNYLKTSGNLVN